MKTPWIKRFSCVVGLMAVGWHSASDGAVAAAAWASTPSPAPVPTSSTSADSSASSSTEDKPAYVVHGIELQYVRGLPFLPVLQGPGGVVAAVQDLPLNLVATTDGWIVPGEDEQADDVTLRQLSETPEGVLLTPSAVDEICRVVEEFFLSGGTQSLRMVVAADPVQIDPMTRRDLRASGSGPLRILMSFEGPNFAIDSIDLSYATGRHPVLPEVDRVLTEATALVTRFGDGYVAFRPGIAAEEVPIQSMFADGEVQLSAGAIQRVLEGLLEYYTTSDFMVVQVIPAQGQFEFMGLDGEDLRAEDDRSLKLLILNGVVTDVRTLASGDRVSIDDRLNNPVHQSIIDNSPFRPRQDGDVAAPNVMRKSVLENYLYRLSRHPGRRVESSIGPGSSASPDEPYGVTLDYAVGENKPFQMYGQVANTGTDATDKLRYRFGMMHTQLTGNDDILNFEYLTSGFDESHALTASYEAKLNGTDNWRYRAFGFWSEYTASQVGFADESFVGESYGGGIEFINNIHQDGPLFIDLLGGIRYESVDVDNRIVFIRGREDFIIPYVGLRLERYTEESRTDGSLTFEGNIGGVDQAEINRLGRLSPDDHWYALKFGLSHSFYIESLFMDFSADDSNTAALANEVAILVRGQYAFDHRLIPQQEQVAGGLYTVRGYPESVAVGDNVIIGTAEYRLHLPRAFGVEVETGSFLGEPFRWRPQYAYGPADWDLIVRAFADAAYVHSSDAFSFEESQSLLGIGLGLEIQYKSNVSLRVDWGFAMEEIPGVVDSGDDRVHFVATFVF